jgi:hypothetical protein
MRDLDVRQALHRTVLKNHHGDANTLVIDELGLRHGVCRVDIAVVNGLLHGFEIKSESDTLARLPSQVIYYSSVLDKATLVVGEKHACMVGEFLPEWWGIKVAYEGARGSIAFAHERKPRQNPSLDPVAIAELLWKNEVVIILRQYGVNEAFLRKPRAVLYRYIAENIDLKKLGEFVRKALKDRVKWRGPRPLS